MDAKLFNEIVAVLIPYMSDVNSRKALVTSALFDSKVLHQINFEGDATSFTAALVKKLLDFGDLNANEPAIVVLLLHVKEQVGHDKQTEIDTLIAQLDSEVNISPQQTNFIDVFVAALEQEKGFERQPSSEKFKDNIPAYIGIHQSWFDINAIALIKADGLTHDAIAMIHDAFFQYLTDWKPPFFLARILKKTGVLCFIYEEDVSQETIDWVKKQQRDTEEEGLVLVDGVRTTSWVITLNHPKTYSNTVLLPMFPPAAAAFHPGKAWVEGFLKRYAGKHS